MNGSDSGSSWPTTRRWCAQGSRRCSTPRTASRSWARRPTAREARAHAARTRDADVVLMDVRMPVHGRHRGDPALTRLPGDRVPRVLVLTTFDLDDYVYEALRAGASGFLLKDAPADDLVHAVRVVAAGEALLAPAVTRRVIEEFAAGRPGRRRPGCAGLADARASARCSSWSRAGCRTARSPSGWCWPSRP